jgi:ureidoacrylate peracid hydrolase
VIEVRRDRAAVVVVDMQHDFVHGSLAVAGAAALARRLAPLVGAARSAGLCIVWVTHAVRPGELGPLARFEEVAAGRALREGSAGVQVVPELDPRPEDVYVVKRRFSAFAQTDLDLTLRSRGIEQLFVCGVSAHVCCDTTIRDAFQLGYDAVYVVDGVEMGDLPDLGWGAVDADTAKRVVATTIAHRFGDVCTRAELVAALEREAAARGLM